MPLQRRLLILTPICSMICTHEFQCINCTCHVVRDQFYDSGRFYITTACLYATACLSRRRFLLTFVPQCESTTRHETSRGSACSPQSSLTHVILSRWKRISRGGPILTFWARCAMRASDMSLRLIAWMFASCYKYEGSSLDRKFGL